MTDSNENPAADQTAFELQDALSAFDQFSRSEIERLQQTEPGFEPEFYERARRLVLSQLEALSQTDKA